MLNQLRISEFPTERSASTKNGIWWLLPRLHGTNPFGEKRPADPADGAVAAVGGAMFASVENDLEVEFVPAFAGEGPLKVPLGLDDVFTGC